LRFDSKNNHGYEIFINFVNINIRFSAYFGSSGIGYSVCRIPIAGSDCSTRPYSYDDVEGDVELVNWALAPEDYDYKVLR